MARLLTVPFETRLVNTSNATTAEGETTLFTGTPSFNTTTPRSGGSCLESTTGSAKYMEYGPGSLALDRDYYYRAAVRRSGTITGATRVIGLVTTGGVFAGSISWHTSNGVILDATGSEPAGASRFATAVDTWYVVELHCRVNTAGAGTLGFRVDGVTVTADNTSANVGNTAINRPRFGSTASSGVTILTDDVAVNDDQGASQNSWCGTGKTGVLLPTVLGGGGRGNWVDGGGGTSNLHAALDNTPPTGTATGSDGTQIENATSGSSAAEFDLAAYNTVVPAQQQIVLVQPFWRVATNDLTGTNTGTGRLFSNPDSGGDDAFDFEGAGAIANTEPAGWRTYKGAYVYGPTVTQSAAPKLRITKTEATTRVHSCDLMGLVVEWAPAAAAAENSYWALRGWGAPTT